MCLHTKYMQLKLYQLTLYLNVKQIELLSTIIILRKVLLMHADAACCTAAADALRWPYGHTIPVHLY